MASPAPLNEHYTTVLHNSEHTRRGELERVWREQWSAILSVMQQAQIAAKACSGALLGELAGSLSQRARPSSSQASRWPSTVPPPSQNLADRLARITSARKQQVGRKVPPPLDRMGDAAATQTPLEEGTPPSLHDVPSGRRAGKAESLRLLVRGTPDQQIAKRVHEAEKSLPRVLTSTGSTTRPTATAAPLPPHTSPSSRRLVK
jgi:hypothetical protein